METKVLGSTEPELRPQFVELGERTADDPRGLVGNARSDRGLGDLRAWKTYFVGTKRRINDSTGRWRNKEMKLRKRNKREGRQEGVCGGGNHFSLGR